MKFNKIYIELTNICGLTCDFCPTKILQNKTMTLDFFEKILIQVKEYTNIITYHVFGDPLVLSNIKDYFDLSHKHGLKVEIVTTAYTLKRFSLDNFLHPCIKQINFSINSFDKNDMKMTLEEYLSYMIELGKLKIKSKRDFFINFRLWNLDQDNSSNSFNNQVYAILEKAYNIELKNLDTRKSKRLDNKILIDFDEYFQWPSLNSDHSSHATCYGLKSHIAILSSGVVVPCCLDSYGIIDLGNLKNQNLSTILESQKAQNIIDGFKRNKAVEDLCQKCSFKDRFKLV
jgi:radical SAM protein with 4Fe4S-binding SPASM domain